MGYLYTSEMSELFIRQLRRNQRGPISAKEMVKKYWRRQPPSMSGESDDSLRYSAQHAMEFAIPHHVGEGHIRPLNQDEFLEFMWVEESDRRYSDIHHPKGSQSSWALWRNSGIWQGMLAGIPRTVEDLISDEQQALYIAKVMAYTEEQMGEAMTKEVEYFNSRTRDFDDGQWEKWGFVNLKWTLTEKGKALGDKIKYLGGVDL